MYLTIQSPSSYEDDDDDSNEEEQVVEQKQQIIQEQQQQEEDDLAEEKASTIGGNSSKRSLFQSGGDSSRNPKKQKMNEVVVALKAKAKRKKQIATDSRRSKLNLIKKIWSGGDVLIILEGLVNYKEKYGDMLVSTHNYEIFLQSIKDLLSFECTVDQLKNKIKKLKGKYNVVVDKLISGVNNLNEGKPHKEKLYELSKIYWGDVAKCKAKGDP